MGDEPRALPLPPGFRERLLQTTPDVVSSDEVDAMRAFCAGEGAVEAAYVRSVERTRDDKTWSAVRFAVTLTDPVDGPDDSRSLSLELATRLTDRHPVLIRELGICVLADRAVPAWEKNAVLVFTRR